MGFTVAEPLPAQLQRELISMITDLLTQINHLNPLRPSRFIQLLYLWQPHLEGSCSSLRVCTGCVCTLEKTQDGEALGFPHSRGWRAAVTERPALSPPGDGGGCDRRVLPAVPAASSHLAFTQQHGGLVRAGKDIPARVRGAGAASQRSRR